MNEGPRAPQCGHRPTGPQWDWGGPLAAGQGVRLYPQSSGATEREPEAGGCIRVRAHGEWELPPAPRIINNIWLA